MGERLARGTLDREVILTAALEVVAEHGVEQVTVPAVARRLGVRPTAVHWHFKRKEDLLAALEERAVELFNARLPAPDGEGPWQTRVAHYWRVYRAVLQADPVLCDLVVMRWPSAAGSRRMLRLHHERIEEQLAVLQEAGFGPEASARAFHALSVYTRGCLATERAAATHAPPLVYREGVIPPDLPALTRSAPFWSASMATDEDFEVGLNALISGLSRLLEHPPGGR